MFRLGEEVGRQRRGGADEVRLRGSSASPPKKMPLRAFSRLKAITGSITDQESVMIKPDMLVTRGLQSILIILFVIGCAAETFSQTPINAHPDKGINTFGSYSVSDVENISMSNGAVNLSIPLASLPPISGGKLSFTFKAYYSSKIWESRTDERRQPGGDELPHPYYYVSVPTLGESGGWDLSNRYRITSLSANSEYAGDHYPDSLKSSYSWSKTLLIAPDGASHELRPLGYQSYWGSDTTFAGYFKDTPNSVGQPMAYYTTDGSYIWAKLYPYSINSPVGDVVSEVYLLDGTKITDYVGGVQRITDTNGNSIKIFTDANGAHYQDEQTGREIKYVCASASQCQVMYQTVGGGWASIDINFGTTAVRGYFYDVNVPDGSSGSCTYQEAISRDLNGIVREIVFPQTEPGVERQKFSFDYNSDTTNPISVEYHPACNTTANYQNPSNGLGELSQMIMPSKAVVHYTYALDGGGLIGEGIQVATNSVATKTVTHDGISDTWTYQFTGAAPPPGNVPSNASTVVNPDGTSVTQYSYYRFLGYNSSLGATGYGGLVYKTIQSNKIVTERHWTRLVFSGANEITDGLNKLAFNPVVDAEYTTLMEPDAGGNPVPIKMSAKKFQYDYNGHVTRVKEYDWFSPDNVARGQDGVPLDVPQGLQPLRISDTSYYNGAVTPDSPNVYAKRSLSTATPRILNALQETTVGAGITQFSYDGQPYGTAPIKGNLTQVSSLDDQGDTNAANDRWVTLKRTYDDYGNVSTKTDANNNVTAYFYEDETHALPTRIEINPLNGTGIQTALTTYDPSTGFTTSMTDVNGQTTNISYTNQLLGTVDPFGRPAVVTSPSVIIDGVSQHRKTYTIYEDSLRRVTEEADLNAEGDRLLKIRTTSDALGRSVLTEQSEDGNTYTISVRTVYEQAGRITYTSNPMRTSHATSDGWTRITKDAVGRVIEVATFEGVTQPTADQQCSVTTGCTGRVITDYYAGFTTTTDQAGKVRRGFVDGLGRLTRVDEPADINNTLGTYDSPAQPTLYTYDVLNNLKKVQEGGQLQGGQYVGGQTRNFNYSTLSRLSSATHPEVCHQQQGQCVPVPVIYTYDLNGNLLTKVDARGVTTTYSYDGLNRVTGVVYTGEPTAVTPPVSYTYDDPAVTNSKGRLTRVSSSVSTYSFTAFDTLGRIMGSAQTTDGITYSMPDYRYNLAGGLISEQYPSGKVVKTEFDMAGRIAGVKNQVTGLYYAGAGVTDSANRIQYAVTGVPSSVKLGNGLWEHINFDSRFKPIQIGLGTSSTNSTVLQLDYSYGTTDNNGTVHTQTITVPGLSQPYVQSYSYDELNRLKSAEETNAQVSTTVPTWRQVYSYDQFGNRTLVAGTTNPAQLNITNNPTVSAVNNRITSTGYSYDDAGNLLCDPVHPCVQGQSSVTAYYEYDAKNLLRTVGGAPANGGTAYVYDGDKRRVKIVAGAVSTIFVYDAAGRLLAEYGGDGSHAGGANYITQDMVGNTRVVTGQNPNEVKKRYDFLPFGEGVPGNVNGRNLVSGYAGNDVRQQFTGYERDVSGLDYAHARYYAYAHGRFTSVDPYIGSDIQLNPQAWNRYAYCGNNPLICVDPSGLIWVNDTKYNLYIWVPDEDYHEGNKYYDDFDRYLPILESETGPDGTIKFVLTRGNYTADYPELVGKEVYLGRDGKLHAVEGQESAEDGGEGLYENWGGSIGSPIWLGGFGGLQSGSKGYYPYIGGGVVSPGPSASLTLGKGEPTPGWSATVQGCFGVCGGVGAGKDNLSPEGGVGTPGLTIGAYYTFGPVGPPPQCYKDRFVTPYQYRLYKEGAGIIRQRIEGGPGDSWYCGLSVGGTWTPSVPGYDGAGGFRVY